MCVLTIVGVLSITYRRVNYMDDDNSLDMEVREQCFFFPLVFPTTWWENFGGKKTGSCVVIFGGIFFFISHQNCIFSHQFSARWENVRFNFQLQFTHHFFHHSPTNFYLHINIYFIPKVPLFWKKGWTTKIHLDIKVRETHRMFVCLFWWACFSRRILE